MKKKLLALFLVVAFIQITLWGAYPPEIKVQLDYIANITNIKFKSELQTNIVLGLFSDLETLQRHLLDLVNQHRIDIERRIDISEYAYKIYQLDKDRIEEVTLNETKNMAKRLFSDLPPSVKIPPEYKWTAELAYKFNPAHNTNDHARLKKDIDKYLNKIKNLPVIKYALQVTNTTIDDLRRNWFGEGRGFEHVFAGEIKGSKVSGYHWWYKFYLDERKGYALYKRSLEGIGDQHIFTGVFDWDPDGPGPISVKHKKKGGFVTKVSPAAILALGHIVVELTKNYIETGKYMFRANLNGENFVWKLYKMGNSIRTLYPLANK